MTDIPEGAVDKTARVIELIDAYRTRGHLMADTDPLNYRQRRHPDLDVLSHGLTLWDLDRTFATGGFGGRVHMKLRDVLGLLRDSYVRTVGTEYMHIADPEQRAWLQERIEVPHQKPAVVEQKYILAKLNAPRRSRRSCRPSTSGRNASRWKAGRPSSRCWMRCWTRPPNTNSTRSSSACPTAAG